MEYEPGAIFLVNNIRADLSGETVSPLEFKNLNVLLATFSMIERAISGLGELENIAILSANCIISQSSQSTFLSFLKYILNRIGLRIDP